MKHLVGKVQTKEVEFAGDKVKIKKLSINDVMSLQDILKKSAKDKDQMKVLRDILRMSVVGADEMSDEDFNTFAPTDLNTLAEAVLEYCGLSTKDVEAGN